MLSTGGNLAGPRRQSCVDSVPSPSVHVPSISARLFNGYPSRRVVGSGFDGENGVAFDRVQMQNGGLGVIRCSALENGDLVNNLNRRANDCNNERGGAVANTKTGPLGLMKRICSDGFISDASTNSDTSGGRFGNNWMLMMTPVVSR